MINKVNRLFCRIYRSIKTTYAIKSDAVAYARSIGVQVGDACILGSIDIGTFGTEPYLIKLGNHVEIALGVRFITHDGAVWVFRQSEPDLEVFGNITIGNNVFVGMNTILLPNVEIGHNVIIGAGSIVNRNIPANSVAVGSPAKVICHIDEYRNKIRSKETQIRHYPYEQKKYYLQNKLMNSD